MFLFEIKKKMLSRTYLFLLLMALVLTLIIPVTPQPSQDTISDFPGMADPTMLYHAVLDELPQVYQNADLASIPNLEHPETYFDDLKEIDRLDFEAFEMAPNPEVENAFNAEERIKYNALILEKEKAILHFFEAHLQSMPQFDAQFEMLKTVTTWHQVEVDHAREHDVPLAYRTFLGVLKEDNLASVLYKNFPFYFGPLFFFLLAIAFHSTFSREREDGTLDLLWTQPRRRLTLFLAKAGAILVGVVIYGLGIFLGVTIECLIKQQSLSGFTRLLRHLTTLDSVQGITTGFALIQMAVGVLALSLLFSGILIFLGRHFSSAVTLALSALIIAFGYVFTFTGENALLQPYNPIALMDYVRVITGRMPMGMGGFLETDLGQTAWGLFPYLAWAGVGGFFLLLSLLPARERQAKKVEKASPHRIKGITSLLHQKIVHRPVFRLYVLGALLMSGFLFFQSEYTVQDVKNNPDAKANLYASLDQDIATWEKILAYDESPEGKAAFLEVPIESLPPFEEWHKAAQKGYLEGLNYYREQLANAKKKKESNLNHEEAYRSGDGQEFWETLNEINESLYSQDSFTSKYAMRGAVGSPSFSLTRRVFAEASRRNAAPVFRPTSVVPNVHEGYANASNWAGERRDMAGMDQSAFYWLYQWVIVYRLPLIVLLLLGLMAFGGYSLDKEDGDQLSLIWTEPISRRRYHFALVVQPFFIGLFVLISFLLINFGLGLVFEGIGPWNYPLPFFEAGGKEVSFLSLWLFLAKTLGLLIAYLFFYASLSACFLSICAENPMFLWGLWASPWQEVS